MLTPYPGTLTHKQLLEKARQIKLRGDVKLLRTENSTGYSGQGDWVVAHRDGYLLTRRGWRKHTGSAEELGFADDLGAEEIQYRPGQLMFMTALEAADFYLSHCTGLDKEPAFDVEVVKLRDYISEQFVRNERERAVKAACSILGK